MRTCCIAQGTLYAVLCGDLNGKEIQKRRYMYTESWLTCTVSQSVQSFSRVQLLATPRTAARQASLSITNSWSLLKLMAIESVMPSNHLILCHPLLLLPSIFPTNKTLWAIILPEKLIKKKNKTSYLTKDWMRYWMWSSQHRGWHLYA